MKQAIIIYNNIKTIFQFRFLQRNLDKPRSLKVLYKSI